MHALAPKVQYGWSSRDPLHGRRLGHRARSAIPRRLRRPGDARPRPSTTSPPTRPARGNPITGPIVVEGAQPGDVLQVDVLDFEVDTWGWTCFGARLRPARRGLPDAGTCCTGTSATASSRRSACGRRSRPFPGVVGVCPAGPGPAASRSSRRGASAATSTSASSWRARRSTCPIEVGGAWFGAGDGHARQGDGEVCGSAVEIESRGRLRLTLRRDLRLTSPAIETPADPRAAGAMFGTIGVEPDLMLASQNAIRRMIEWLVPRYGITPEEAYLLCSVRGGPADQRGRRPAELGGDGVLPAGPGGAHRPLRRVARQTPSGG